MRQLTLAAVAVWLGAMGFFAFIVAPAAFATLDREAAGRFVSVIFPRYYAVGLALGLVALFGLAKRRTDHSVMGSLKGKLAYMSPEQARTSSLDRRSDIFALGAVLLDEEVCRAVEVEWRGHWIVR